VGRGGVDPVLQGAAVVDAEDRAEPGLAQAVAEVVDEASSCASPGRALPAAGRRVPSGCGRGRSRCGHGEGSGKDGRVAHSRWPCGVRTAGCRASGEAVKTLGPDSLFLPGGGLLPPPQHDGAGQGECLLRIVSAACCLPGQCRPPLLGPGDLRARGHVQPSGPVGALSCVGLLPAHSPRRARPAGGRLTLAR
jgi:hypothetical protein